MQGEAAVTFYKRTQSIAKGESDAFIKQFVALDAEANAAFKYTGTINLKDYVGLYSDIKTDWLAELGFKGMSYEFSIPENIWLMMMKRLINSGLLQKREKTLLLMV